MSKDSRIPEFETFKEAGDFWDTHSLADFADELEEAKEIQFTKKSNLVVSLDLEKGDMKRLRVLANRKGVKYTDLINLWIKERLREI